MGVDPATTATVAMANDRVAHRLGVDAPVKIRVAGWTDHMQRITLRWRDGAGRQSIHPDPPKPSLYERTITQLP
jgi:hypothetical protein